MEFNGICPEARDSASRLCLKVRILPGGRVPLQFSSLQVILKQLSRIICYKLRRKVCFLKQLKGKALIAGVSGAVGIAVYDNGCAAAAAELQHGEVVFPGPRTRRAWL